MPTLSPAEIHAYAIAAGFSKTRTHRGGREDVVAVAVALGESGGNTHAHNPVPPDNSYGLWQINMIGALGPARRKQFGISSNEQLFDPATNARAAVRVFHDAGNSFRPWTVYTSGRYLQHMAAAIKAAGQSDPSMMKPFTGEGPGNVGGETGLSAVLAGITSGATWIRVAEFIGGMLLIIAGVLVFAGKNVGDIVPVGKLVKAVKR